MHKSIHPDQSVLKRFSVILSAVNSVMHTPVLFLILVISNGLLVTVKASPVHLKPVPSDRKNINNITTTNPKPQYKDVTRVLKEVVQAKQTIWILLTEINVRIYIHVHK